MDGSADVEKKLGLSLDELIAQQKAKQAKKGGAAPGAKAGKAKGKGKGPARVQKVQTQGGGRVLVVPRPKHVPRPGTPGGKQGALLKATRGGGVHKGGPAPKFAGGAQRGGQPRAVKVTIGNKLRWVGGCYHGPGCCLLVSAGQGPVKSRAPCHTVRQRHHAACPAPTHPPPPCSGRPAGHIPTSGVLAKPFMGGNQRSSRGSAMQMEGPGAYGHGGGGGGALGTRFDHMQGSVPSGPARPTGAPRRNAHGVILP